MLLLHDDDGHDARLNKRESDSRTFGFNISFRDFGRFWFVVQRARPVGAAGGVIVSPHKAGKRDTDLTPVLSETSGVHRVLRNSILTCAAVVALSCAALPLTGAVSPAVASEIMYVVNNEAITSLDVQRRAAFLKLQRRKGNLSKMAGDEMVEQVLKQAEIRRLNIRIPDASVDAAFRQVCWRQQAVGCQMASILDKAGVTAVHFKEFMRTQMGWGQAVSARYRSQGGSMSEQDAVQRMLKNGGAKPTATEYMLQQVNLRGSEGERKATLGKRKKEADALRARFSGCDQTRAFAKGLLDVTVRDLGRMLGPELPPEWAEDIKKTKVGGATTHARRRRAASSSSVFAARAKSRTIAPQDGVPV